MFSLAQLKLIRNALLLAEKSVSRLANKEGQPDNVVREYLAAKVAINDVVRVVEGLYVEQESKEKLQASSATPAKK